MYICKYILNALCFRPPSWFLLLQIGVILRDSNGIAQVRAITGSKILRVLKANGEHHRAYRP